MTNWDAIGAIGEILGAGAVVLSLLYLAVQIRHTRKQSELESLRDTWAKLNQLHDKLSESKEIASIVNRGRQSLDSLDGDEYLMFEHIHLRLLNTLESWYMQVTETSSPGNHIDAQMENIRGLVRRYLGFPGTRQLWSGLRPYFLPIQKVVDDTLDDSG